jgi:hypothetical protein
MTQRGACPSRPDPHTHTEMEDVCRHILFSYARVLPPDLPTRADQLAAYIAARPPAPVAAHPGPVTAPPL